MIQFPKRAALAVVLAAGALAAPTAANAAVTSNVNTNTLTVASDQAADTITLAAAGGFITVNGQATTLAANDQARIAVDGAGGDDTVDATALAAADYGSLTINGGDGDDLLSGGADADGLNGNGGDDRLVGFKNTVPNTTDVVTGGDGNDTMVWNNGDGTDVNDGDDGDDEVEVNGALTADDAFIAKPGVQPGRVQFNRLNLVAFGIDFSAERLTVNGLGGNDSFAPDPANPTGLAGLTSLTLNGGTGTDALTGGDGADLITGGDDGDALDGGGGDDRVVGDRGSDTLSGGNGDDALVWNNGDGTDVADGDAGFDRVEINGSPTAGDVFTIAPAAGGRVRFDRTNLVPFFLDIATSEELDVNGLGGDDQFSAQPGTGLAMIVNGNEGNDALSGSERPDALIGGSGNDRVSGGSGNDRVSGGPGRDRVSGGSGPDRVSGGSGNDRLSGGPGDDALNGGPGIDSLFGGPGQDSTRQ
jgi:Ca2+-binding RTX toxin-like protein